ncbi:MAG: hypothetical protein ACREE0_05060 [Phenylobacterium sp.]
MVFRVRAWPRVRLHAALGASGDVDFIGLQPVAGNATAGAQGSAALFQAQRLTAAAIATAQAVAAMTQAQRLQAAALGGASGSATLTNSSGAIAVGSLVSDGPPTPEQISLWLPTTGTVAQSATATCRYKLSSSGTWITGHPLYRIRPDLWNTANDIKWGPDPIEDGFAWVIIDLLPGQSYDVEVTVTEGASNVVKNLTHTTRALPGPAAISGSGSLKTANSQATFISQLAGLNPGDVLTLAAGTYAVPTNGFQIERAGSAANPIYIRGASRTGTVLTRTGVDGRFFTMNECSHLIIENMTLQGGGIDGDGVSPTQTIQEAFAPSSNTFIQSYITIRNITATGIDSFVSMLGSRHPTDTGQYNQGWLVYDNTAIGNNLWQDSFLYSNITWNDPGIKIPGRGNCGFQNTLKGFGDTFSFAEHFGGGECDSNSVHYYRNEVRNSCDDPIEADHGRRNCTWYDNRIYNAVNATSCDPIYCGPIIFARNIYVNLLRARTHKWNSTNSGHFVYNNTILAGPVNDDNGAGDPPTGDMNAWYQPSNGPQNSFGYRNNLHVYRGASTYSGNHTLRLDNGSSDARPAYSTMDWTHNSWFPDRGFRMPHNNTGGFSGANLAAAKAAMPACAPVFSGQTAKMFNDNITVSNPWTTTITLPGSDAKTEYTGAAYPILAASTAPKNSGVEIANITDGFSGASPDRGAVIEGRTPAVCGDQSVAVGLAGAAIASAVAAAQASVSKALAGSAVAGASASATLAVSVLQQEAQATSSNTFRAFTGGGLSTRAAHPFTGTLVDPTEDGQSNSGDIDMTTGAGPDGKKTAIDWAGKGCYDSQARKVMWAGTGAEGSVASTPINTHAIYDEDSNTWSVVRGWTAGGEGTSDDGSGHMYDGNCIDVTGRRFFKKKFQRAIYVKNLTTGAWTKLTYSSGEPSSYGWDAGMDYIPSRDRLWIRGLRGSDNGSAIHEVHPTTGALVTVLTPTEIGSDEQSSVCSFNPRAFGNQGGCFVGGSNAYTVRSDGSAGSTPSVIQSNASGKPSAAGTFSWSNGTSATRQHLCRDPVGDGWIYACSDGFIYRLTSAGVWTQRAALPSILAGAGLTKFVMVPIDAYGVIWFITNQGMGAERAWLYRP